MPICCQPKIDRVPNLWKTANWTLRMLAISSFSVIKDQPNAKRQTPNAKRQTPNAKRQTPNAKRQTPNAKRQTPNAPSMTRLTLAALSLATLVLNGCDNRTREAVRWDQIAEAQKTDKKVQKWPEAESPWSNAEHHTGIAW
jgi:hypothetical protein